MNLGRRGVVLSRVLEVGCLRSEVCMFQTHLTVSIRSDPDRGEIQSRRSARRHCNSVRHLVPPAQPPSSHPHLLLTHSSHQRRNLHQSSLSSTMMDPSNAKGKSYADRPATPLGNSTGLTSTPVSGHGTPSSTTPPEPNPYHYQPAQTLTRPDLSVLRRNSSNYAQAHAESLSKQPEGPASPQRTYSFSVEDHKRSKYEHLMTEEKVAEVDEQGKEKQPLKSPGIGNSEVKGREFGFTSTG